MEMLLRYRSCVVIRDTYVARHIAGLRSAISFLFPDKTLPFAEPPQPRTLVPDREMQWISHRERTGLKYHAFVAPYLTLVAAATRVRYGATNADRRLD